METNKKLWKKQKIELKDTSRCINPNVPILINDQTGIQLWLIISNVVQTTLRYRKEDRDVKQLNEAQKF